MQRFFKLGLALFFCIFLTSITHAAVHYDLTDFQENGIYGGASYLKVGGRDFLKTGFSPDLELGPFSVGFDINIYLPTGADSGPYPSDLSVFALRHVSYDDGEKGFTWGRLRNVTLGYGLLMDQYDSGMGGTSEFNTLKAGALGYYNYDDIRFDVMWTVTNVKAARASYTYYDSIIMGSPVIFGATYVEDSDGINENFMDKPIQRERQEGLAIDLGLPIAGDFLTGYLEYAHLYDRGKGGNVGFKGNFFDQFDYRMEYRRLGAQFVPGYFNTVYEATSFDFDVNAPDELISGYLASLGMTFMDGAFKGGMVYEKYDDRDGLITGALGWSNFSNTTGVLNYTMPFNGKNYRVITADIIYKTNGMMDYICHGKRTYVASGAYIETWSVGTRVDLGRMFPMFK
jgi:hypothetical protein